jgi:hypothetical protein
VSYHRYLPKNLTAMANSATATSNEPVKRVLCAVVYANPPFQWLMDQPIRVRKRTTASGSTTHQIPLARTAAKNNTMKISSIKGPTKGRLSVVRQAQRVGR